MEDDAATVALRTEEAGKAVAASEFRLRQPRGDRPQRPCPDLEGDLARLAFLRDLRNIMNEAASPKRQSGSSASESRRAREIA